MSPGTRTSFGSSPPPSAGRRFGTRKSETPLIPGGRAVDARQRHVHDVLGQVVIAAGDEDLRAARAGSGRPAGVARVWTSARLEPACGSVSAMVPVHAPAYMGRMKRSRSAVDAEGLDQVGGAAGQARVAVGAQVAGHQVQVRGQGDGGGDLLPPDLGGPGRRDDAERGHARPDLPEHRVDVDRAVPQQRRLHVERAVGRVEDVAGESPAQVDPGVEGRRGRGRRSGAAGPGSRRRGRRGGRSRGRGRRGGDWACRGEDTADGARGPRYTSPMASSRTPGPPRAGALGPGARGARR